ncbi:CHASE2 domain-containing protein [Paraburkholderia sp. 1N]|uniref:CHASE2 domain-containing protein n=1 Tax=Paraburkholderia solitsugae TaxID=2675748 RepID=A0ABX2C002_9BURK|nr:CHASE2 domain-containing protein [Paraburkholderia solitsugae]
MTDPTNEQHVVRKAERRDIKARLTAARSVSRPRWKHIRRRGRARPRWVRRWFIGFALGCAIEAVIHVAGHTYQFGPIVAAQNWGLDVVNRLNVRHCSILGACPEFEPLENRPMLVRIDDETWRNPAWGGGEPNRAPQTELGTLVDHAFQLGARQVVVDIAVEDRGSIETTSSGRGDPSDLDRYEDGRFASSLSELVTKPYFEPNCHDRKLIVVRSERRPLPQDADAFLPELRQSKSIDRLIASSGGRIVAAAPYFEVNSDQVLREWDLFRVVCERGSSSTVQGTLRIVPSVQLLTRANELNIRSDVVELASGLPCAPFPALGASQLTASDLAQRSCELKQTLDGQSEASGACGQAGHGDSSIGLKKRYWEKIREAFSAAGAPIGELPDAGEVGNRIVFRYPPDKMDILPALPLLNFSAEFMQQWRDQVQGRVVVIGQTFEEAGDKYYTPLGRMPGALVLANAIDSMAENQLMREPNTYVLLFVILTIFVVSFISATVNPLIATTVATLVVIVVSGGVSFLFFSHGVWLDFSAPIIGIQIERWIESIKERRELNRLTKSHDKHN